METEMPNLPHSSIECQLETIVVQQQCATTEDQNLSCESTQNNENEEVSSMHGFLNDSTNSTDTQIEPVTDDKKQIFCEGSDSGVEVLETTDFHRALSSNSGISQDYDNACARSCDSSIISCCSNYDEVYNILVRKNSTLLEDYTLRNGDVTSENGSESSSLSGSNARCRKVNLNCSKKKLAANDNKKFTNLSNAKDRSRLKPPVTPFKSSVSSSPRLRSIDRLQNKSSNNSPKSPVTTTSTTTNSRNKPVPNNLDLHKRDITRRPRTAQSRSSSQATPTEDTRWINNKSPTCMTRSYRAVTDQKPKLSHMESKTIEKYATLPRRKKEKDKGIEEKKTGISNLAMTINKRNMNQQSTGRMFSSLHLPPRQKIKTKIYHEMNIQTALTMADIEKAFEGAIISPKQPEESDKCSKSVQVDMKTVELDKVKSQVKSITEKYEALLKEHHDNKEKLKETEEKLLAERVEKEGLKEELNNNSQRVLAILGNSGTAGSNNTSDSLLVLESRFENVSQVVIQQEEEISRLNNCCRSYQLDLEKSLAAQKTLIQQHQDLEAESIELQEFMQAEKTALGDALRETENEVKKYQQALIEKDKELDECQEECKHLTKIVEQKRLDNCNLQARIRSLEVKSRELLVHQGSTVSGASVALSSLIDRVGSLVDTWVISYNISEQELDDIIYYNEAYNNSSSSVGSTPEKSKLFTDEKLSPTEKGSSFISAIVNAIKNAATGRDMNQKDSLYDRSSSNEMLDSETEPCLMMEHVLEDVVIPDGYSHNMISSGHGSMLSSRMSQSESIKDVSNVYFTRQCSDSTSLNTSLISDTCSLNDILPQFSLVDQVIEVDNVITRLLKVLSIVHLQNNEYMTELQDQRDSVALQIEQEKETNKLLVKQLRDWEILGDRLNSDAKEVMNKLSKKNNEVDSLKSEINNQREQIEKLNQDVCELSTALAKAELEMKVREDEIDNEIKKLRETGNVPSIEILSRILISQNEVPILKEKLIDKEKRLNELNQEFLESRQVLSESLKDAVTETKRQYEAIDRALEVLHSIQSVVHQCPPLTKLQRDLEEVSFQSASTMPIVTPPDCNANAGLIKSVTNLEISQTINTTA